MIQNLTKDNPVAICFQETKLQDIYEQEYKNIYNDYVPYFSSSTIKKGYSGVVIYSHKDKKVLSVDTKVKLNEFKNEGRMMCLEYEDFYLINTYVPNSGSGRLKERIEWDNFMIDYIRKLKKCVVWTGDFNCAPCKYRDVWKTTIQCAGCTPEERNSFKNIKLTCDLIDSYRSLYPEKNEFTYWSFKRKAREFNKGMRLDYFLISKEFKYKDSIIMGDVKGSDHCPIKLIF
jgi:exodeoxyribonuclease-3